MSFCDQQMKTDKGPYPLIEKVWFYTPIEIFVTHVIIDHLHSMYERTEYIYTQTRSIYSHVQDTFSQNTFPCASNSIENMLHQVIDSKNKISKLRVISCIPNGEMPAV